MLRYAITDRMLLGEDETSRRVGLLRQAAELARRGVDFLQLREKDLPAGELVELARELLRALRENAPDGARRTRLLVNARVDVAIAADADGVHLTSAPGELTAEQVRLLYGSAGLAAPAISVSCHTLEDVRRAASARAVVADDPRRPCAILFGPVFEKRIHGRVISDGCGLETLRQACRLADPMPVLALGGVAPENTAAVLAAGVAGVAGIRLFACEAD